MTQNSASVQAADKVAQEITFAEQRVLNTTTYGLYHIVYSAMLIGNPQNDPTVDANLSSNQLAFRNALQASGYLVGRDASSGYWTISWDQNGPEAVVSVYEIATTVVPGPVSAGTITALENYFTVTLSPPATVRVLIDATATSGTYFHLAMATQQNTADNSADVRAALIAAGLTYSTGNTTVVKRG